MIESVVGPAVQHMLDRWTSPALRDPNLLGA
jgi:hypothetical protein